MDSLSKPRQLSHPAIKIRHFEILRAVSDSGSILGAARNLNMTQPAVTKALHSLELHLGCQLFTRMARGVIPTAEGEILIQHARIVLSDLRLAENDLMALTKGHAGQVLVGTLLAAAPVLLPKAVARLKALQPGIHIRVTEATNDRLFPALLQGELDIVVGRQSSSDSLEGLEREVLYQETVRLVVRSGHPLLGQPDCHLRVCLDFPWIFPLPETSLRRQLEKSFSDSSLELPQNIVETVSILMSRTLLAESDSIAAIPEQAVADDVERGLLAFLPIDMPTAVGPVGITKRKERRLSRAAESLVACLHDVAADISD